MNIRSFLGCWARNRGDKYVKKYLGSDEQLLVLLPLNNLPPPEVYRQYFGLSDDNLTGVSLGRIGFIALTDQRLLVIIENILGTDGDLVEQLNSGDIKDITYDGKYSVNITDSQRKIRNFETEIADRFELSNKLVNTFHQLILKKD